MDWGRNDRPILIAVMMYDYRAVQSSVIAIALVHLEVTVRAGATTEGSNGQPTSQQAV